MPFTRIFTHVPRDVVEWGKFFRTLELSPGTVTDAQIRDSAALSVLGRAVNSVGTPTDVTSNANDTFLVRRANTLVWEPLQASDIPTAFITADMVTQHMAAIRALMPRVSISPCDISADMITQHMAAIRSFLPKPPPQADEFQSMMASRVFRRR